MSSEGYQPNGKSLDRLDPPGKEMRPLPDPDLYDPQGKEPWADRIIAGIAVIIVAVLFVYFVGW